MMAVKKVDERVVELVSLSVEKKAEKTEASLVDRMVG